MIEMLKELAILSPLIMILVVIIIYFYKKESNKDTEIKRLNEEIRKSEHSTMEVLNGLTTTLEYLTKSNDDNSLDIKDLTKQVLKIMTGLETRLFEINTKINNQNHGK